MVDKTLATFKVDPAQWELFKARCAELDSNATKTILNLIDGFLDGRISLAPNIQESDIKLIDERLDERIGLAIAPLKAQMEEVQANLGKFRVKSKGFAPDR